ncbi:hypothetical protein [Klebsiella aerogenes]|uniref:hypothetical protein n=1 Tax=Klebsiella aerogenes TaxID=548 RepID=UPI003890BEA4|nr:hypothetical protein [Klebsiella aerogenes]
MKRNKNNHKEYDRNSRRTTMFKQGNKVSVGKNNAFGGNPVKRIRDLRIIHDYMNFMSPKDHPLAVMMLYRKENSLFYERICSSICNETLYVEFGYLAERLYYEYQRRGIRSFSRVLNPTEKEAVLFLSNKYHLSDEAIRSIIKKSRSKPSENTNSIPALIHMPPKRIYLDNLTHQQQLELEQKNIDHMESVTVYDIEESQYQSEDDRQAAIESSKLYYDELRNQLSSLERRAKEEPDGKAFLTPPPPRPTYLHTILSSEAYQEYEHQKIKEYKKRNKSDK